MNLSCQNNVNEFENIYGSGIGDRSAGIPLFVFNYLDYKIWQKYADELRGKKVEKGKFVIVETSMGKEYGEVVPILMMFPL